MSILGSKIPLVLFRVGNHVPPRLGEPPKLLNRSWVLVSSSQMSRLPSLPATGGILKETITEAEASLQAGLEVATV
ncbi:hypothetical protein [Lacinutrix jangbogonensis]|uniref:hypothetical protein n=1 Tax=Lacinutrix jangbogonensis TaxID=1469557 RepID=UPI0012E0A282|nr:hypothetical protein [Lacinutrix jangbogonensis]